MLPLYELYTDTVQRQRGWKDHTGASQLASHVQSPDRKAEECGVAFSKVDLHTLKYCKIIFSFLMTGEVCICWYLSVRHTGINIRFVTLCNSRDVQTLNCAGIPGLTTSVRPKVVISLLTC